MTHVLMNWLSIEHVTMTINGIFCHFSIDLVPADPYSIGGLYARVIENLRSESVDVVN